VSGLDVARFKEVVGHFATGVVVVTALGERGPAGFTCQSFGSLSLEPTLVSFAAATQSNSWPQIRTASRLAINVLGVHQEALARLFATSVPDKFDGLAWSPGVTGAPVLEGTLASIEGEIVSVSAHGDHDLAVVAVTHAETHEGTPLVYYRRGFGSFLA
jgi:flavin reductase (DIM6/NTAB) family NADH-FMN oxidoreductase RutF